MHKVKHQWYGLVIITARYKIFTINILKTENGNITDTGIKVWQKKL